MNLPLFISSSHFQHLSLLTFSSTVQSPVPTNPLYFILISQTKIRGRTFQGENEKHWCVWVKRLPEKVALEQTVKGPVCHMWVCESYLVSVLLKGFKQDID